MSNKFKHFYEEAAAATTSGDVASFTKPIGNKVLKRKKSLHTQDIDIDDEEGQFKIDETTLPIDMQDYDIDGNDVIDANDIKYLVSGLSRNALIEITDLIASYLEKRFNEPGDAIPADGKFRVVEEIIRKVQGDRIITKSSLPGFKCTNDGREIRMTDKDAKQRIKDALIAAKKRYAKNRKKIIPSEPSTEMAPTGTEELQSEEPDTVIKKI